MQRNRANKPLLTALLLVLGLTLMVLPPTERVQAATFTVTNTGDAGTGTLLQAIADANNTPGDDTINFAPGVTGTIILPQVFLSSNLTINGPGAQVLTVRAKLPTEIFANYSGASVTISGLTITGGSGAAGGAIHNSVGTITINDCTISGNSSPNGGGIFNLGTLTVNNSTISGNTAVGGSGGGIWNLGTLTINNSTISGNAAVGGFGGGVFNLLPNLRINNSTISDNTAVVGGGLFNGDPISLKGCIFANNSATTGAGPDIYSNNPVSGGFNLVEDTTNAFLTGMNNITGVDPMLGLLQNNGGPTQTHALFLGSPAIDALTDCTDLMSTPVTTDQRGSPRPQGSACDIGAFEASASTAGGMTTILQDEVEELLALGTLPQGAADGLLDKLDEVLSKLELGNGLAACNQLRAFLNQVNSLFLAGTISQSRKSELEFKVELIRQEVGCR